VSIDASQRRVAWAHGIVGLTTCACLIAFYLGGEPFGVINDVGNALLGLLSLALAWYFRPPRRTGPLLFAAIGAVVTVVGTILVLAGITDYFLAGLVSSVGFALIGVWLTAVSRTLDGDPWTRRMRRAGLVAAAVMMLGFINLPSAVMGVDDIDAASAWTYLGGFSWAGTYLLFPSWSLSLDRTP
jgi:hypothetical protein